MRKKVKKLKSKKVKSGLNFEDPKDLEDDLNQVFYGASGTGKTTLACDGPKPLLLVDIFEKGTGSIKDIKGIKVLQAKSWDDLQELYWYLNENPSEFKTVVIDTISQVQQLVLDSKVGKKGGNITQKMWGTVGSELKNWILNMRDLEGVNAVFIAHDKATKVREDDDDDDIDDDGEDVILPTIGPRLMPSVVTTLNAAVDVIGQTYIRRREIKVGKKTKVKIEYCLRLGPHSRFMTKARKPKDIKVPLTLTNPTFSRLQKALKGDL
jgi:hypothetical protein